MAPGTTARHSSQLRAELRRLGAPEGNLGVGDVRLMLAAPAEPAAP